MVLFHLSLLECFSTMYTVVSSPEEVTCRCVVALISCLFTYTKATLCYEAGYMVYAIEVSGRWFSG